MWRHRDLAARFSDVVHVSARMLELGSGN